MYKLNASLKQLFIDKNTLAAVDNTQHILILA